MSSCDKAGTGTGMMLLETTSPSSLMTVMEAGMRMNYAHLCQHSTFKCASILVKGTYLVGLLIPFSCSPGCIQPTFRTVVASQAGNSVSQGTQESKATCRVFSPPPPRRVRRVSECQTPEDRGVGGGGDSVWRLPKYRVFEIVEDNAAH